jgi:hypothetical protein
VGCKDNGPSPEVVDARRVDAKQADGATDAPASCFQVSGTPANCFDQALCTPAQLTEFLNGCTDGQCIAFDNVARLPLYNNGALPPLP